LNFLLQNIKLQGKKLVFEIKTPFNTVLQANKCSNLLTWQKKFRTFDWINAIGDLETTNKEINHLLSLTNN